MLVSVIAACSKGPVRRALAVAARASLLTLVAASLLAAAGIAATTGRAQAPAVSVPAGDLLVVAMDGDIGSRISNEGQVFAVTTTEPYAVNGRLVLPKGSPGYGTIDHVKRSGRFHAGGELSFTVDRLIAPDGTAIDVTTNGATADADKQTEHNGGGALQAVCIACHILHRGNDILVRAGTVFHVATRGGSVAPSAPNATPRPIDRTLLSSPAPDAPAPAPSPTR